MTAARYIEGLASALVLGGGLWASTAAIRERFLISWSRAPARLARLIIGIGVLVLVAELLGTIGQLHLPALVATIGALGLISWGSSRLRKPPEPGRVDDPATAGEGRREGSWERIGALVSVAMVAAEWGPGWINSFRTGMTNVDSLWYHMPIAAQFAQSGSVIALHNINNDNVIAFYPATSELIHAVGIEVMGSDVLSLVLNLAWLALALFAAWCLGSRFGVGSLAVMGTAMVMGTTELVADEPGGAYNDIVGIALVLSAVALLAWVRPHLDGRPDVAGFLVAALATGLALGVKYTFVFPVIALTVGAVALIPRGHRVRIGVVWCGVVVVAGGLWYVRNWVDAGNPLPNVHVSVGILRLPSPKTFPSYTVWHVIFHWDVWRADVLPGLSQAFGPGWWLLLATAAVGSVAPLLSGAALLWRRLVGLSTCPSDGSGVGATGGGPSATAMARLLSFVGLATLVGYLFTPEPNLPSSIVYDLRFVALTVLTGTVALALLTVDTRWRKVRKVLLVEFGVLVVASQFAKGIWWGTPSLVAYHAFGESLLVGVIVLATGGVMMQARAGDWERHRLVNAVAAVGLAGVVTIAGFAAERFYLARWYRQEVPVSIDRWADTVHRARIGVSGLTLNYPLYGSDLTNDVVFIGAPGPDGSFAPILTCEQWRSAINAGHFQYVVSDASLPSDGAGSTTRWTRTDPEATFVVGSLTPSEIGYDQVDVFRINGRLDPGSC